MIEQKDFDKLKQSDRIEYLLRSDRLEQRKEGFYLDWVKLIWSVLAIVGFILILALQFLNLGYEETYIKLLGNISGLCYILLFFCILMILWNFICRQSVFPKWDKKLDSYFFKREIKPVNKGEIKQKK